MPSYLKVLEKLKNAYCILESCIKSFIKPKLEHNVGKQAPNLVIKQLALSRKLVRIILKWMIFLTPMTWTFKTLGEGTSASPSTYKSQNKMLKHVLFFLLF